MYLPGMANTEIIKNADPLLTGLQSSMCTWEKEVSQTLSLVIQIQADLAECQLCWVTSRSPLEPQFICG